MINFSNSKFQFSVKILFVLSILILGVSLSLLQEPKIDSEINLEKFQYWSRKAQHDSILMDLESRYKIWKKNGIEEPIARTYKYYLSALSAKGVVGQKDSILQWVNILADRIKTPEYIYFYYQLLAEQNLREGNWELTKELLEKVERAKIDKKYPLLLADVLSMLSYIQSEERNFNEALSNTKKADSLLIANMGRDYAGRIMVLNNYGIIYGELGDLEKALEYAQETRKLTQLHYSPDHKNQSLSLNNLSVVMISLGRYDESLEALEEALKINIEQKRNSDIFLNYMNMAAPYISKWDYSNALNYLKLAESMLNDGDSELDPYRIYLYTTLIAFHFDLKDYDSADAYLKKAIEFGTDYYSDYSYPMGNVYLSKGNMQMEKGDYAEAIKSHEKALEIYSYYYGEESSKVANGKYWIGQIMELLDSLPRAIAITKEAVDIYSNVHGADHRHTIESRIKLSELYFKNNDFEESGRILNNILDRKANASGKKVRNELIPYTEMVKDINLISTLELKIKLLSEEYRKNKDITYLKDAARAYEYIGKEYDRILANFGGFKDRDDLRQNSELLFKNAVAVCYELYETTGEREWSEKAYTYSERARAMKIQEIMRDRIATNQSGLPDSIILLENQLKSHLKSIENQLVDSEKSDSIVLKSLNKAYLMVNQEYNEFVKKLEKDYTKYYDLKYNVSLATPDDVRTNLLNKDGTLIQYILLDSTAYVHIIGSKDFNFVKLDISKDLDEKVKEWYKGMKSRNFHSTDEYGKDIFNEFIGPLYSYIENKDLMIVPDGALYYINFESLPMANTSNDYMLEHHNIQYCYSPTVQVQTKKYRKSRQVAYDWVGFVPGFSDDKEGKDKEYAEQPWAVKASETIAGIFKSKLFSGKDASISSFQNFASQGEMLHMGTHAVANDEDPLKSYFVLSGEEGNYDLLYANEIFNSEIQSKCAVLTACETGVGQIKAGEGMVSLARAFSYAGCPNLILTLWPVDDEQTGALIESFYRNVVEGKNFDDALYEAKKQYLKEARGELKHPYYWAGLMYYGHESNINKGSSTKAILLYSLPGLGIIILIGLLIRKRRISTINT